VYAEDPAAGFLPQAGRILAYVEPAGPGIRVDGGVDAGDDVPVQFDPLVAKLIVSAADRPAAIARARAALARFVVLGIRTNTAYLQRVLGHPDFAAARVDTRWLDRVTPSIVDASAPSAAAFAAAVAARASAGSLTGPGRSDARGETAAHDPWSRLTGWRHGA
jgi:acetyl/propionyl-CoA carboxylase alpha subunit